MADWVTYHWGRAIDLFVEAVQIAATERPWMLMIGLVLSTSIAIVSAFGVSL